MKLILAGTPEFAAKPFKAVLDAGFDCVAVYTQPDRPAGRGRSLTPSPVKQLALEYDLPVCQPLNFKAEEDRAQLAAYAADLMLVIAYGLILPQSVLDTPALGCVNLHASLLPRWRGAAPIQRAIEAGDEETGLCLMQMEAGLDTGPVLARDSMPIGPMQTGGELHDALASMACEQLPGWLRQFEQGGLNAQPQDDAQASYAHKLKKSESRLNWQLPASDLARQLRAFDPWPGSSAQLDGQSIKLSGLQSIDSAGGSPGQVLGLDANGIKIACGEGSLVLSQVQFPGARSMRAEDAARGRDLAGRCFE